MAKIPRNSGFEGRMFLTEAEWQTYCRRMPVRYIRKSMEAVCQVCGNAESPENPVQNAHVISFNIGVIDLALTPEFLDSHDNIATAHRIACNKATKLDLRASMACGASQHSCRASYTRCGMRSPCSRTAPNEFCATPALRIDDPNSAHNVESGSFTE
jgi:hypothetical protein